MLWYALSVQFQTNIIAANAVKDAGEIGGRALYPTLHGEDEQKPICLHVRAAPG